MTDAIDPATVALTDRLECDRLLNTWLRERHPADGFSLMKRCTVESGNIVEIPLRDGCLEASCVHVSPMGFHEFAGIVLKEAGAPVRPVATAFELAQILLAEVDGSPGTVDETIRRIGASIAASRSHAAFLSHCKATGTADEMEQGLWFGHPFHPLAKSVGDFSADDVRAFAPERRARFQLSWLLAEPSQVDLFPTTPDTMADAADRLAAASGLSPKFLSGRVLFPCHPWQAKRLANHPGLAAGFEDGSLELTGPSGDMAMPTSSVRTVWFPEQRLFVKLAMAARITNFSRVNTYDQIARSISGSKALSSVSDRVCEAGISILPELGGGILRGREAGQEAHHAETGFILRDGTFDEGKQPFVVAGLLEMNLRTGRPNLETVSPQLDRSGADGFVSAYVDVVLLPLLHLYETTGIALEAHAQNSLVTFRDGRPTRLHVRDLEGIAVHRETYEACGRSDTGQRFGPSLFYERNVVWRRLLYYVVVNHFAHVLATVSKLSGTDEAHLWAIARGRLEQSSAPRSAAKALLSADRLPAKANLLSCLADRGETPDYVMIPNPLSPASTVRRSERDGTALAREGIVA